MPRAPSSSLDLPPHQHLFPARFIHRLNRTFRDFLDLPLVSQPQTPLAYELSDDPLDPEHDRLLRIVAPPKFGSKQSSFRPGVIAPGRVFRSGDRPPLTTARAFGLTIPQSILIRADQVIQ